ncbi:MAG: OsmC family protein [Acidimicrobiales bacterium]
MRRDELRALQAPLKERYRADPDAARITLQASGTLDDGVACSVATGRAVARAGLHPATGGDGLSVCSGDMLLQALVACAGVTLRAVATSLDVPVTGGTVHADGDLDFRGTLAVAKDAAVGFTAIRLRFELDSDAPEEALDTLVRLTERYCVVYQTLSGSAVLSTTRARPGDRPPASEGGPHAQPGR